MKFSDYMGSNFEGAGFLFVTLDNKILMLQKPNKKWSLVGGHSEKGESPLETAQRECKEEIGFLPEGKIFKTIKYKKAETKSDCYSFVQRVDSKFKPRLSWEHIDYKWIPFKKINKYVISKAVRDLLPHLKGMF
jgi:8-oxo-dGTP pyrophosphatase MutT (NUDIX family)